MLVYTLALALLIPGCKGESTGPDESVSADPPGGTAKSSESPKPAATATPSAPSGAGKEEARVSPGPGQVLLDGELIKAHWDDGDTFAWTAGGKRVRARLADYNTLESYGPVHKWGEWSYEELYGMAKEATKLVRSAGWECQRTGTGGGYGRVGVRCPGAAQALIEAGLAHVFSMGVSADVGLLAKQAAAIASKKGMWAKGAPEGLVTSLHSADEPGRDKPAKLYDRVASLRTGSAAPVSHDKTYAPCDEVCRQGSCMRYIPFKRRYGKNRMRCPAAP